MDDFGYPNFRKPPYTRHFVGFPILLGWCFEHGTYMIYIYIYIYTYVHRHVYIYIYIYIHIHTYIYTYTYIHIFIYSYIHIFKYSYFHIFKYSYIHIFIYSYIHIFIYSYIYIFIYSYIHIYISTTGGWCVWMLSVFLELLLKRQSWQGFWECLNASKGILPSWFKPLQSCLVPKFTSPATCVPVTDWLKPLQRPSVCTYKHG